jgi:hypothetical protein
MTGEEAGRDALGILDGVLRMRPQKDGRALGDAMGRLCLYRDALIEAARRGGPQDRARLGDCNGVLSVVAGVRFPLGEPPWEDLEKARGWLSALLDGAPPRA